MLAYILFCNLFNRRGAREWSAERIVYASFLKEIGEQRIFFHCLFAQILSTELSCQKL
jgi:hypothetical protein